MMLNNEFSFNAVRNLFVQPEGSSDLLDQSASVTLARGRLVRLMCLKPASSSIRFLAELEIVGPADSHFVTVQVADALSNLLLWTRDKMLTSVAINFSSKVPNVADVDDPECFFKDLDCQFVLHDIHIEARTHGRRCEYFGDRDFIFECDTSETVITHGLLADLSFS